MCALVSKTSGEVLNNLETRQIADQCLQNCSPQEDLCNTKFSRCSFAGSDFSGRSLTDVVFDSCDLSGVKFTGSRLERCTFLSCKARYVDLSNSTLMSVRLNYSDFDWSRFSQVTSKLSSFQTTSFVNAHFHESAFIANSASRCQFLSACFNDANLELSKFASSSFQGSEFIHSELNQCRFSSCNFSAVNMTAAMIFFTDFSGIQISDPAKFKPSWSSHNLLYQLLMREALSNRDRQMLASYILGSPEQCWDNFLLVPHPERQWAAKVLLSYNTMNLRGRWQLALERLANGYPNSAVG